jgi:hypothetical protein
LEEEEEVVVVVVLGEADLLQGAAAMGAEAVDAGRGVKQASRERSARRGPRVFKCCATNLRQRRQPSGGRWSMRSLPSASPAAAATIALFTVNAASTSLMML